MVRGTPGLDHTVLIQPFTLAQTAPWNTHSTTHASNYPFSLCRQLSRPAFPKSLKSDFPGRKWIQHLCCSPRRKEGTTKDTNKPVTYTSFTLWEGTGGTQTHSFLAGGSEVGFCHGRCCWHPLRKCGDLCHTRNVWQLLWHPAIFSLWCQGFSFIQNCLLLPPHRACRDAPLK